MSYKIILADPPWQYNDKSKNRGGAERHYPTMSLEEMSKLNVLSLADRECALCMWVTLPHLFTAGKLIDAWGFEFVTGLFGWVKTYADGDPSRTFVGMGHYTRSNLEVMLLARPKRGRVPKRINASIRQIQHFPVLEHSEKPKEFHDLIVELWGDLPRIELFARRPVPGWAVWGNEVESDVTLNNSPFNSFAEAWNFATKQKKIGLSDFRIICPACFNLGEIEGVQSGDGGFYHFECVGCGYTKSQQDILHFDTALKTIARGGPL